MDSSLCHCDSSLCLWNDAGWDSICLIGDGARRHHERLEEIESAGSLEATRLRPGLWYSGGSWEKKSDVVEGRESGAGQKNPSARKESGDGEE